MEISEKITSYYDKDHHFKEGIAVLRNLTKKTRATETYKWSSPVYTLNGKNVFWISRFKNHFSVGFFNGVFLKDPEGILINAQEGKTKAMRHVKFKSVSEIDEKAVLAYMEEALENQQKGLEFKYK
ncbi:MAG: DUF1801 domain-containing protein [Pricia sp.]